MSLKPLHGSLANWTPGAHGTADPVHAISAAWATIVGFDVAANSAPVSLAYETLTIATRSSAWSQQLHFLSPTILRGIRDQAAGAAVKKLVFRAGAFRAPERRTGPSSAASVRARKHGQPTRYEPAVDLAEAFARVRARIADARRSSAATCAHCGAPLGGATDAPRSCAPCAIGHARERTLELERLLFAAPWLSFEEIREQLPRVTVATYERSRRSLLARWWLVLERARTARRLGDAATERSIASSFVLLQSRLPPDRITPAVVGNALGAELATLLYGERAAAITPGSPSRAVRRSY